MNKEKINVSAKATGKGVGFCGLLTIAFIILKLCNIITWPWVWVLAPLWISFGFAFLAMLVLVILIIVLYKIS